MFRFKKFIVRQEGAVMKVCTDSCLFGAWAASRLKAMKGVGRVLDIGTGTGLLSLMIAQQVESEITAIDIDEPACRQARENVMESPWPERIYIEHASLQQWRPGASYDAVICNPPFFTGDLRTGDARKDMARHDSSLQFDVLLDSVKQLLNLNASFFMLLPWRRTDEALELAAERGFYLVESIAVRQTAGHDFFRNMMRFSLMKNIASYSEIQIKEQNGDYSSDFCEYLAPYYLYL